MSPPSAGAVNISARQTGNENYFAAEEVVQPLVINVVLGVEDLDIAKRIHPNPTRDVVHVDLPGITSVTVIDIVGRSRHARWLNNTLDFSELEAGVYLIKASTSTQSIITRVIKN